MTKQTKMGIGLILASFVLLAGVVFFSRAGIRRSINHFRAERLYKQAQEAFEAESWNDAIQKGRAAHYLDTEDEDIQLLVARALLYRRNLSSVEWWKRILNKPDLPVDDLREVTKFLLIARMYDEALPFLKRLVELDSNNPETQNLWLTALQAQRNVSNTRALVDNLIEKGSSDWAIHKRYLNTQQTMAGEDSDKGAIHHLLSLIESQDDLALLAARELALRQDADRDSRLKAAAFLLGNGEDTLDRLLAQGIRVKEEAESAAILPGLVDEYLASDEDNRFQQTLQWALWMDLPELALDHIDWETYLSGGGAAELYFQLLLQTNRFEELLEISQRDYKESDPNSIIFLAYRASAQRRLGMAEDATATLQHAVQIVDPNNSAPLERFLLAEGQWDLLVELYESLVQDDPENTQLMYRYLAALYYTGNQTRLQDNMADLDLEFFENQVNALTFVGYLKLVVLGFDPKLHQQLESLMSEYPEIYDFRLIVGLSYLLQGKTNIARSFADNMPELTLKAPRHLRVCAALLQNSITDRFGPTEFDYLMPRERFLLSRIPSE